MATVSVRYIVDDVDAAIDFYCGQLGFAEVMHPDPAFAMLTQRRPAAGPAAPVGPTQAAAAAMPDGTTRTRRMGPIMLEVEDLEARSPTAPPHGRRFRNEIVTGIGSNNPRQDPAGNPVELFEPHARRGAASGGP